MKKHISIVSRLNKLKAFFIFWAEQRYGVLGSCQFEQKGGFSYCRGGSVHPHIDVLEAFDPNLAADPFRWIPKGLMQDLMDNTNETGTPVIDQVSGYTNQQMYSAFQSNIYTLQDYRLKLLQTTSNSTSAFVTNLFAQYHY